MKLNIGGVEREAASTSSYVFRLTQVSFSYTVVEQTTPTSRPTAAGRQAEGMLGSGRASLPVGPTSTSSATPETATRCVSARRFTCDARFVTIVGSPKDKHPR